MNKSIINKIAFAGLVLCSVQGFAQKKGKKAIKEEKLVLENNIDTISYGVGLNVGQGMVRDFSEANIKALLQGLEDSMTKDGMDSLAKAWSGKVNAYFKEKSDAKERERLAKLKVIATDGIKFLEENKKNEGVKITESGLQYIVLKEGEGKQPSEASSVTVHYHGTTPEGKVFDSSVNRNKPATFGLNQVIKGWTEGLQLMKEGAKYKFFIPQELAYGSRPPQNGQGLIKEFMPLVFEVELITVNE